MRRDSERVRRERHTYTASVISHSRQRGKTLGIQKIKERHFTFKAQSENMSHAGDVTLKTQR